MVTVCVASGFYGLYYATLVEEDTQSWGGTWHKFTPNPTIISIGMALEGGARAPGAPLLPPPMR